MYEVRKLGIPVAQAQVRGFPTAALKQTLKISTGIIYTISLLKEVWCDAKDIHTPRHTSTIEHDMLTFA